MSSSQAFVEGSSSGKGSVISIIGGKYVGLSGWIDKKKDATREFVHVIIRKGKDAETDIKTKVKHENYVLETEIQAPSNYEEAMFQQNSDIDALLNKLVKSIAECDGVLQSEVSMKNIFRVFKDRFEKAKAHQDSKGSKARWRKVCYSK
jgi:hypothetical protein